jgi:hypothetical protein
MLLAKETIATPDKKAQLEHALGLYLVATLMGQDYCSKKASA